MTKEEIQHRLSLIDIDLSKVMANYNALLGAKQELEFWLEKLKHPKADDCYNSIPKE